MLTIVFEGHIPSKKNSKVVTRSGHIVPSKAYREWHTRELITLIGVGGVSAPFAIDYQFWIGGTKIPADFDLSNALESINDLLVDAEVIEDDRWRSLCRFSASVAGFIRGESKTMVTKTIVTITPIEVPWYDAVAILKGGIKAEAMRRGITQKAIVDECWDQLTSAQIEQLGSI